MREDAASISSRPHTPLPDAADLIQRRIDNISAWLAENAPDCRGDQKHLDEGTAERAYWHYGYLIALRDIQNLLGLNGPVN